MHFYSQKHDNISQNIETVIKLNKLKLCIFCSRNNYHHLHAGMPLNIIFSLSDMCAKLALGAIFLSFNQLQFSVNKTPYTIIESSYLRNPVKKVYKN
jgi:hypothetical protein